MTLKYHTRRDYMKIIGKNPITGLDYPDPDVIRVDDTYYMVSTTMHFVPGCEILRSYDLVHWEHLSYVYERLDSTEEQRLVGEKNCYGKGMWAASLRYHKGMYYICFVANDTGKTYLYTADNIEGPWEKRIIEGFYHDCSLLFEDDHVYIVSGNRNVRLQELKKDLGGPKEGGLDRILVSDSRNPGLGFEGSHFYKINGMYYLFLIHSLPDRWMRTQACYVSDSLTGEFRGGDVLCDTMGYCGQGVAQGGIVDTPDHKWYAVLFQDRGAVGRIPVLVPVKWEKNVRVTYMPAPGEQKEQIIKENYPVLGDSGRALCEVETKSTRPEEQYHSLVESDDFSEWNPDQKRLFGTFGWKSCWQFNHEPELSWIENDAEKGCLRMSCKKQCKNVTQAVNTITQRMKFPMCITEVTVDAERLKDGDYAGMCALQGCYGMAAVTKRDGRMFLVMRSLEAENDSLEGNQGNSEEIEWEAVSVESSRIRIRLEADFQNQHDKVRFLYWSDEKWKQIGPWHQLYFKMDHFTGCRVGLFAYATKETGGIAEFGRFRYF